MKQPCRQAIDCEDQSYHHLLKQTKVEQHHRVAGDGTRGRVKEELIGNPIQWPKSACAELWRDQRGLVVGGAPRGVLTAVAHKQDG